MSAMSHQIILETLQTLKIKDYQTMNSLTEHCGVSRPTMSDRVRRCENRGLLFTMKSGREKLVYLTIKGRKLREKIERMESALYGSEA